MILLDMKMPPQARPSGFHICDILDLNDGKVTPGQTETLPPHSSGPELTTLTPHGLMFPGPQLPETIPPHWPSALTELRGEYCTAIVTYNPLTPSLVPVLGPGFLSGTMADLWSVQSQCCIVPYRAV
ncbi:hypothetical protein J6590_000240 [Homalodisca vitripennis]|nr:hypothetical protein J6590_000240 [Homalodisca vitripennis]